jgi:indole-3-glycerol phosphate synthase
MSFLSNILEATRESVVVRKRDLSLEQLKAATKPLPDDRRFLNALHRDGVAVIAEFKRSSPSEGSLAEGLDIGERVSEYQRGGADALSVLTETSSFHGSLADLRAARAICDLPILDKDFIVDEYQVYEAAQAGADAILLIVAALEQGELRHLHDLARGQHLDVLVEVRSADEFEKALDVKADLVGINNRRLQAPNEVDIETTYKLVEQVSKDKRITIVSESGIKTREELDGLAAVGVDAALIGTALMKALDPEALCRELTRSQHRSEKTSRPSDQHAFVA